MPSIDRDLVALLPNLRAYALFLTGNRADADDLVQDTAVRLLGAADRFEEGTNFKAWAFRVLRNRFLNEFVAKRRNTRPLHEMDVDFAPVMPTQAHGMELRDLARQFMRLPPDYRSVLALAAGEDMAYEDIAAISNCAVGTVKSRVHRARAALMRLMHDAYRPVDGVDANGAASPDGNGAASPDLRLTRPGQRSGRPAGQRGGGVAAPVAAANRPAVRSR